MQRISRGRAPTAEWPAPADASPITVILIGDLGTFVVSPPARTSPSRALPAPYPSERSPTISRCGNREAPDSKKNTKAARPSRPVAGSPRQRLVPSIPRGMKVSQEMNVFEKGVGGYNHSCLSEVGSQRHRPQCRCADPCPSSPRELPGCPVRSVCSHWPSVQLSRIPSVCSHRSHDSSKGKRSKSSKDRIRTGEASSGAP